MIPSPTPRATLPALCLAFVAALTACTPSSDRGGDAPAADGPTASEVQALRSELDSLVQASGAEVVGVYYRVLDSAGDSLTLNADVRMHAASTMKVPVMMQLYLDQQEGRRELDSTLTVHRTFRSIVDRSPYELPLESDSDTTFYGRLGEDVPVRYMIDRIAETMTAVGADSMSVLRGVEDLKAFEAGLSNTTTARSLGAVMAAVATSELFTEESRREMLDILSRQHFTAGIPAGVPEDVMVANKTGWITGIQHDAAVVMPPDRPHYVLVVMVRGHPAGDQGEALTAEISRRVWAHHARAY